MYLKHHFLIKVIWITGSETQCSICRFHLAPPRFTMRYRRTSNEDRSRIVESYDSGEDFLALAHTLGVQRSTAYSIVRTYQREDRSEALCQAGGRPKSLDNETLDLIVLLLEANPEITLRRLLEEVRALWPLKPAFSRMTLCRALEGEMFSVKMTYDVPADRNSVRVKEDRRAYAEWLLNEAMNTPRVYVDETGFNLWTKRTYGRSRVGTRVNRVVGGQRGRNATVIAAIADGGGVLYHEVHFGKVNGETFKQFMVSLEVIIGGSNSVIIMDNAPVHRGIIEEFPALKIKMLPPYSPFLNPIENCFSVFKTFIKQYLATQTMQCTSERASRLGVSLVALRESVLQEAIEVALPQITRSVVERTYGHANTYLTRCLQGDDIFH